jgi:outer membrane biosynthesis protein TonB
MDRSEAAGVSVAVLGHLALFGLLSVGFLATPNPMKFESAPIEVSLSDDVGLVSAAPDPTTEAPAERLGEEPGPIEPDAAPLSEAPPEPAVAPKPTPPKPAPAPEAKPAEPTKVEKSAAPAPSKALAAKPVRPTGRLTGILNGLTDTPSDSKSTRPPAATAGPAVQSALAAEIRRQLKPHWRSPTGADVELLRTVVEVRLNRDGSLAAEPRVTAQTGVNASNRVQADLHKERAIKAVTLAAPFRNLPPEFYDAWKQFPATFDRRL